jgi:hypothetical protein
MKDNLLFSIKREALDFERLFLCCKLKLLTKTLLQLVTHTKIVEGKVPTHSFINLDLYDKC